MNNVKTDKDISMTLYVIKAIAIICVAAAHCGSFSFPFAENSRALLGTMGVPVFMICSGYFVNREQNACDFWKKKLKNIVVPWILWGIATYAFVTILGHSGFSVYKCIKWIIGYKTWLYFVPVLLACFVIFRVITADWWLYLNIGISLISLLLTYLGVFKATNFLTLYQNPFNFSMFFAIGILLKRVDLKNVAECRIWIKYLAIILMIVVGVFYAMFGEIGYWKSLFSIPFELLSCVSFFFIAYSLRNLNFLEKIGKSTYFTYLTHSTIGSSIVNIILWNHLPSDLGVAEVILAFVKPSMTVLMCFGMCIVIKFIAKKIKLERLLWILGI